LPVARKAFNIMPHYRDYVGMMAEPYGRLRAGGWRQLSVARQCV